MTFESFEEEKKSIRNRLLWYVAVMCLLAGLSRCAVLTEEEPPDVEVLAPTATATATPKPTPAPTATPEPTPAPPAEEITGALTLSTNNGGYVGNLRDKSVYSFGEYRAGASLIVESEEPMGGLYLTWYREPVVYTVIAGGGSFLAGEDGYLYEYIQLPAPSQKVELKFSGEALLSEIRAFTPGYPPEDVQVWEPPLDEADVLVFSTHADDDVIFFGALIVSCVERGLDVEVCYLTDHNLYAGVVRSQELLCALWEMGVRHYPVIGPFEDLYTESLRGAKFLLGEENVLEFEVEMLRRFRPLVAVGHDRQGEYGHGVHKLNAWALEESVPLARDETVFPASAEKWGVWDVPKTYLHYAEENPIVLDVEIPLEGFGGRTAFEVAQDAMLCHVSQLVFTNFRPKLEDKYSRYDCRMFGLILSGVGGDTGNDIMENTAGIRE